MSRGTDRHRVLIVGGGVAALESMVALRSLAGERVEIELLSPDGYFSYRPLAVAEPFTPWRLHHFDIASLAAGSGARHRLGTLVAVEPESRRARTSGGAEIEYDSLLVATGARQREALPRSLTFRGFQDVPAYGALLEALEHGLASRVVFAVPSRVSWPLPLYELALQTAEHATARGVADLELTLVTPEERPLGIFGSRVADAAEELLASNHIRLLTRTHARSCENDCLRVLPDAAIPADCVVSLPRLVGIQAAGLPQDADGFLPVDEYMRVRGVENVYAAGDGTTFPVKQGGIAAEQADVAARAITAQTGCPVEQEPFRPVLRGLLLTGGTPTFLRAELTGGHGNASEAREEVLWWPAAKIAGRYLAPYLAERVRYSMASPWDPDWPRRGSTIPAR